MTDEEQLMARLQRRVSALSREKLVISNQYVDTLTRLSKLRRLLDRWQAVATQMYNHNQFMMSKLTTYKDRAQHWRALCRTNAALSDVRERALYVYKRRLQEANLCSICLTAPITCLLQPCYHGKFCCDCVLQLMTEQDPRCPLCRSPILRFHKYFI